MEKLGAYGYRIEDDAAFHDCVTLEPYVNCLIYFRFLKMVPYILVNGRTNKNGEGESRFGLMDPYMRAVGKTIQLMEKED